MILPRDDRASTGERLAWISVILLALIARLYDLGARVMSHDESIHAFGSYELFEKGVYRHDPAYHGPLMYYVNAAVYTLFGDSDVTARLAPALIGTAMVAAMWLFRRYIGRKGAFCAAMLVAASPTLLFYSRYIREDIYVALFTVIWVWGAFRYLEERRPRWLYVVAVSMALAFATKESAFLTGGIVGSFFVALAVARRHPVTREWRGPAADLAVLMFTLVIPFAAGAGYFALGWNPVDRNPGSRRLIEAAVLAAGLVLVSVAAGTLWFSIRRRLTSIAHAGGREWLKMFALFWTIEVLFFTTFLTNPAGGLITGVAGSAGYWLTQHEVGRGSQPWFYYLIVGGLYEFLPILAGGAAAVILGRRARNQDFDPVAADDLPRLDDEGTQGVRRLFVLFAIWWTIGSWLMFGWAGERMPWLLVHQVLPLMLLAGWASARLVSAERSSRRAVALIAIASATAFALIVGVARAEPFRGRDIGAVAATAAWWSKLLLLSLLVPWLAAQAARSGRQHTRQGLAAGALLLLATLTLRTSVHLTYVNYDLASEPISYAQGSPDVKRVMRAIDEISERTVGPRQIRIAFDDESTWPFRWYFREYPNGRTWGTKPEFVQSAPIVLAGRKNLDALRPYVDRGYSSRTYILYWWPLQDYAGLTLSRLWSAVKNPQTREYLWRVFLDRDYGIAPAEWPLRREIQMFVRRDFAAPDARAQSAAGQATKPHVVATPTPERVITGPFAGAVLNSPTSVTVAPDGAWVIADGGNHRIVILETDGTFRRTIGAGRCAMTEAGHPGCVDPDGGGPLVQGDGQFNEPWGAIVSREGELFVSDTWNGRIQVFDRRGVFARKWGRFGQTGQPEAPDEVSLFGPRGLVAAGSGGVLVTDTGNKRLLMFDRSGTRRDVIGPSSQFPEFFDEPAAIAVDANGTLLVADAWNQRIVRLDTRRNTLASWPVPGWRSRSAADKPALAVDDSGLVYASDPESGRVFVFNPAGWLDAAYSLADNGPTPRPTGIAIDTTRKKLLVLDNAAGELLVFPLGAVNPTSHRGQPEAGAALPRPSATTTGSPGAVR